MKLFALLLLVFAAAVAVSALSGPTRDSYDFIIVGAGSAGSVVAGELAGACKKKCNILVIEAGGDATDPKVLNTYQQFELFEPYYSFLRDDQTTIPAVNYHNREITISRGKLLGGSFGINAMYHVLGHPSTWDNTAAQIGNNTWTWKNTDKYRKKFNKDFDLVTFDVNQPGGKQFVDAVKSLGYAYDTKTEDGANGITPSQQVGVYNPARPGGIRTTSWNVKVEEPAWDNVHYLTHHVVAKVLINAQKVATGVEVINTNSGQSYSFSATKEVILSAGTFRTPQILQLSGIGPAAHLNSLGIPVVANLPVGDHLNDHVGIQTYWESTLSGSTTPFLYGLPNFQFFGPQKTGAPSYQLELSSTFASVYPNDLTFSGTVRLASTDPLAKPIIDYSLTDAYEESILWGVKNLLFPIVTALRAQNAFGEGYTPVQPGADDATIRQYIQETISTNYHPIGTARVGDVVDANFKVKGVSHLRVVDASVHRIIPTGNINAPTLALAYFGADVIARENKI